MMPVGGFAPIAAHDASDVRESRGLDDESSESFAGILAGAIQNHASVMDAVKPKHGTSELDQPEDAEDGDASRGTDKLDSADTTAGDQDKKSVSNAAASPGLSQSNEVVRSVAALDPALQAKLARVIARVKKETGLNVNVAETYRSQSRQDALYAQGRDAAGPIVTWTRNSQHTAGRAVDLEMSGGPSADLSDGYKTLQRIASEEGLRTLGARDPGHLELPAGSGASGAGDGTTSLPAAPADASGPGQVSIARVAQLARVAEISVAQPAQVARVSAVARADAQSPSAKAAVSSANGASISGVEGDIAGAGADQRFGSGRDSRSQSGAGDSRVYSALSAAVALRDQRAGSFSSVAASGDVGSMSADRTARILAALDDAPARPLSQITLNVDAANGDTDRIQLSLRGAALNATIDTADPRAAQAMSARGDELARALTRDGIDLQSLHVRSGALITPGGLTATPSSQGSSDSSTGSRFERSQAWQQQDKQRSQQDKRNQQREQRGGQTQ